MKAMEASFQPPRDVARSGRRATESSFVVAFGRYGITRSLLHFGTRRSRNSFQGLSLLSDIYFVSLVCRLRQRAIIIV